MKGIISLALLCALVLVAVPANTFAEYIVLHEFTGASDDGAFPGGSFVRAGSTLYGMTWQGGFGWGVIFKINVDGSGFELLHRFAGGASDGLDSVGALTLDGSTLYGMTVDGGAGDFGVIFKINTDGSGFELLHAFGGFPNDGYWPLGSLTISGSTLYGMTRFGGVKDLGVIFKINGDGSGYELLHEFSGGPADGGAPNGSLTVGGSTLYGMTRTGGASDLGVIFKINTDGSVFELLHEFAGPPSDGRSPTGNLTLDGSILYGMTPSGGASNSGVVFRINTDGSEFELTREFAGGTDDGRHPHGSLTFRNSIIYGMTSEGGVHGTGVVFKMNSDGSDYELLHEFSGGLSGGNYPLGSPTFYGPILYGATSLGGDNDFGVIFSLSLTPPRPIPTLGEWGVILLAVLLAIAAVALLKRKALNSTRSA